MKSDKQMSKPRLSLSMIIKNEEKFLEGCLESVKGIVDEIVVVDTGSSDASKDIASRFGAKIFDFQWIGDFSAARNFALQQCDGDWILYLDADERLKQGQGQQLQKLLNDKSVGAYNVLIENPHSLHQGNFNQENSYPRFFRRSPNVKFEGKVHEQLWPSLLRQKAIVKQSSLVIQHLGYGQGYDVVKQKTERNLELLRNQVAESPDDAYAQFQIGNSLVVLQRYDEAQPELERAIANDKLDRSNRASCYNLLAEIEVKRKNFPAAIALCQKSLQLAPNQMMAHWFLSLLHFDLREFDRAIEALRKIEELLQMPAARRANQIASDLDIKKEDLYLRFGLTYESASQHVLASKNFSRALDFRSDFADAARGFARCMLFLEDSGIAIQGLLEASEKHPERTEFFFPLATHYRKSNKHSKAMQSIQQAIAAEPKNADAFGLAARLHVEAGNIGEAQHVVDEAQEKNLRSFELHKCGMQLALQRGDVNSAFRQLELMAQMTTADLTPLKNRIAAIAAKLSPA